MMAIGVRPWMIAVVPAWRGHSPTREVGARLGL
jgi:hypothetical protein